ncbi:hypothetical protein, partial [Aeromonas rivipollensis]|uniref:hypothetical protein n=1 Tax=Aeromonas rivipollensis TaxID=948519 RepID=UPI003D25EDF5
MATSITGLTNQTQYLMFGDFYAILAKNHNVTREMVSPLSFREISKKIGEKAAFLMLSLLDNPNCSKEAIEAVVEVIHSLAGDNGIYANSLHVTEVNNGIRGLLEKTTKEYLRIGGFSLHTRGFLNTDLEQLEEIANSTSKCNSRLKIRREFNFEVQFPIKNQAAFRSSSKTTC